MSTRKRYLVIYGIISCLPLGISHSIMAAPPSTALQELTHAIHHLIKPSAELAPITLGNPKGRVTAVLFTDFNCGYCRKLEPNLEKALADSPQLRLVIIDYPILAPSSLLAAKAAIAASRQNKFAQFHQALMNTPRPLDQAKILRVAKQQGLNTTQLIADINLSTTDQQIRHNLRLGQLFMARGTPLLFFAPTTLGAKPTNIHNGIRVAGYLTEQEIEQLIARVEQMDS